MRHLLLVTCVLLAACGSPENSSDPPETTASSVGDAQSSASPSSRSPSSTESPAGIEIISAGSDYGPMLYDATGQPIYLFTAEPGTRPGCYDECAAAWPPVLTTGEPVAGGGGVREGLLGTTRRADGSTQVTYAGHPLYFYAHEGKYQVLCHDVEEFGGTWLVVRPDGTAAPG